ncbi:MAG: 2-C-methyl-D-erythritol 4-phosphate cytidylyltransferase [bacterium]|nr:2-C-methyl-D-erythritol 4-phosphate cytidylyltransferase [bacterium]
MRVYAIILAAGSGRRMGTEVPKQFLDLLGKPVLAHTLQAFEEADCIDAVVLVTASGQVDVCREQFGPDAGFGKVVRVVAGGIERQDSVAEGLAAIGADAGVVAIHDGARPLVRPKEIEAVVEAARKTGAAVLGTQVTDTVKVVNGAQLKKTLDRSRLWAVQTPQAFRVEVIRRAHEAAKADGFLGTDDTALVERLGETVSVVPGRRDNVKVTTPEDLAAAEDLLRRRAGVSLRIGQGYDVHQLVEGRLLILGGVTVPFEKGLLGHSDADVLSHVVIDAILGGLGAGDIGQRFPDTDPDYKGISSLVLLERVAELVRDTHAEVLNVDATVMAQRPKLAPHIPEMRERMAEALGISVDRISVKATTTEGLGFVGTGEGMAAQAVALVQVL